MYHHVKEWMEEDNENNNHEMIGSELNKSTENLPATTKENAISINTGTLYKQIDKNIVVERKRGKDPKKNNGIREMQIVRTKIASK